MLVNIARAAEALGISTRTLHRWDKAGIIPAFRTAGGHRRYDWDALLTFKATRTYDPRGDAPTGVAAVYARVSSQAHKEDLARQRAFLEERVRQERMIPRIYSDIGSGLNDALESIHSFWQYTDPRRDPLRAYIVAKQAAQQAMTRPECATILQSLSAAWVRCATLKTRETAIHAEKRTLVAKRRKQIRRIETSTFFTTAKKKQSEIAPLVPSPHRG